MGLPKFNDIIKRDSEQKQIAKWTEEITSKLNDTIALTDQFNKDIQCKDSEEVSVKLYLYKKNNLMLFHKLLTNHFLELCKQPNELQSMGKIELKNDDVITIDNVDLDIDNIDTVKENITQQWPMTPNKRNGWNMLHSYKFVKPTLPEYNIDTIQKLINTDQFLSFALLTIEKDKGYEEAIKIIYNKYIKDDDVLSKQLKIYENYYMSINENINQNYVSEINNVLDQYELSLFNEENIKMSNYVYEQLSKMIDVNADMVEITLSSYDDNIKSELYDFFNTNSVIEFVEKCETSGITYKEIMDMNKSINTLKETFSAAIGLSELATEILLNTMTDLELINFLYIDEQVTITIVFFSTIALIFKKSFNI